MSCLQFTMFYLFLIQLCLAVSAHKMLVINHFPLTSHNEASDSIVRNLLHAGHQVTYIAAIPLESAKNLTQINYKVEDPLINTGKLNISNWASDSVISLSDYLDVSLSMTAKILKCKTIQHFLKNTENKFDLVIGFWNFNELISGVAALFGCPLVWVSLHEPNKLAFDLLVHRDDTNMFSQYLEPDSLAESLGAIMQNVKLHIVLSDSKSSEVKVYKKIYKQASTAHNVSLPDYSQLIFNSSMVLFASHPSVGLSHAMPSNAKYVGGIHFDVHSIPLSKELQKSMDSHNNGIVYINLGKDIDTSTMPKEIVDDLVKMLGELKQTVFWEFEKELKDLPSNVIVRKSLPQLQILAHHNTLAFITSGELSSLNEAIHYGVPVIGVPLYLDQFFNVHLVEKKAYGLKVKFGKNLAAKLKIALLTILQDPSYAVKAKFLSDVYNDRPLSPAEELLHWADHVAKTRGARHLASPGYSMPWYQNMYGDQTILYFVLTVIVTFCCYKLLRKHCCKPRRRGRTD